jgi:hypothetical protein
MSHLIDVMFLDANEMVSQIDDFGVANIDSTTSSTTFIINNNNCIENICHTYWRPSDSLIKILRSLYENDYAQYPCIPCSYYSRLLYPHSTKWIVRDETTVYPFQLSVPETPLTTHPCNPAKIAVCSSCKSRPNNRINHVLAPIPACIQDVPYAKRKYLSPIYLHTSLGRSVGANPFVEYRSLNFFQLLEELRTGRISDASWKMLEAKHLQYSSVNNSIICSALQPLSVINSQLNELTFRCAIC